MNRREFLKTGLEGIVLASAIPKLAEADEDRLVWKLNIGFGDSRSSPAIAPEGTIYIGSHDRKVYAINPDGSIKWLSYDDGIVTIGSDKPGSEGSVNPQFAVAHTHSAPALGTDGTIYYGAGEYVRALNSEDGTLKWEHLTAGAVSSSPALAGDDTVYVGSMDGILRSFDKDGTLKGRFPKYGQIGGIHSSPAIDQNDNIYFTSYDGHIYSIDSGGSLRWNKHILAIDSLDAEMDSSPAIDFDGNIYVGSGDANLYVFYPNGEPRGTYYGKGSVKSSPIVGNDGTVYIGEFAVNPDGTLKWKSDALVPLSSPAIGSDGTVYLGSDHLHAVNPDGTIKWTFQTGDSIISSPVISDEGIVYFGCRDGYLYAVDTGTAGIDRSAPWPMFGHDLKHTRRASGIIPSIEEKKLAEFSLSENYPNPFNPTTTIEYNLPKDGEISLKVYDVLGQEVATLVDKLQEQGPHQVNFYANNLSSGVYFSRLKTPYGVKIQKMMLVK